MKYLKIIFALCVCTSVLPMISPSAFDLAARVPASHAYENLLIVLTSSRTHGAKIEHMSALLATGKCQNMGLKKEYVLFRGSLQRDSSRIIPRLLFEYNVYGGDVQVCLLDLKNSLKNPDIDKEQTLYLMDLFIKRGNREGPVEKWLWDWAFKYDRREYLLEWYKTETNRAELTPEQVTLIRSWQLIELAKRGSFKQMHSFFEQHEDSFEINVADDQGTALMHTIQRGNYACAKLLMKKGADVGIDAELSRQRAFDLACYYKDRSKEHRKIYKLIASAASSAWRADGMTRRVQLMMNSKKGSASKSIRVR